MIGAICCFLVVGLALGSSTPGWKDNSVYVYQVNGRTLSSLYQVADQYSGIFLRAKLHLALRPDGKLQGKINDAEYAQIQSHLPNGWRSAVPESELSYKKLPLSQEPFHLVLEDGIIEKLIVEKHVTNWEANIIKSIVGQFQLDLKGKNALNSPYNSLPSEERMDGVFKTMEETVTGKTETLYEIHRFPAYLLQSEPWFNRDLNMNANDHIVEVVKTKNHTHAQERPSYHYGFADIDELEPSSNSLGQFFNRESKSRAILTGKMSRFTVQNTYTVNKIIVNPNFSNKERGSVISMVNVTLSEVKSQSEQPRDLSDPIEIGNLVYTYEDVFSRNNQVRQKLQDHMKLSRESSEEDNSSEMRYSRFRRSADQMIKKTQEDRSSEEYFQHQPRPQMTKAPESPLLPYLIGYQGRSIKENRDFDIKQNCHTLAKEIASEVDDPEQILKQSTLNKYTILCSLARLMDEDEMKYVAEQLYTPSEQGQQRLAWQVYRDAVADAGTGPAFLNIQQWIESKKIQNREAASVVDAMSDSVRTPTEEYMRKFFEFIKRPQVQQMEQLNDTALLSYADLVNKVYVNRNESHNQFPVHSFGSFYTKEGREFVYSTVIPYFTQQLQQAVAKADSHKIHVYVRALGNIGDKKILAAFEPYLEGKEQVSQFQRMLMVCALDRLVENNPRVARAVLYKIYQNVAEIPEIRVVAVYQLIRTNPPVEMLQRMAEFTNTDRQEQVNAAVKSAIETASQIRTPEGQYLQKAAESAKPLLNRKQYGGDQSFIDLRTYIINNMETSFDHKYLQVGSQDSDVPRVLKFSVHSNENGMYHKYFNMQAMISSVRQLVNALDQQTERYQQAKYQRRQQSEDSEWSSAKIAQLLNYQSEEREQLESYIFAEMGQLQKLWTLNNHSIERLPENVRELEQEFQNGKKFNYLKLKNADERALSFPTEMGIPFLYTYDRPILVRFQGKIQAQASPQISKNNKLHKPDQISAQVDCEVTVSTRAQSHLSFVTPFDHQLYIAGCDKNFQVHIPIKAAVHMDVQKEEAKIQFDVQGQQGQEKDTRLVHYSTNPYTSRCAIISISPISLRPNTHLIKSQNEQHRSFDAIYGNKQTGMSFRISGHHPEQFLTLHKLVNMWKQGGLATIWQQLWDEASMQNSNINVAFIPSKSTARKVTLRYGQNQEYKKQPENQNEESFLTWSQLASKLQGEDTEQRQQAMLKHVGAGIQSAKLRSADLSLEFEGENKYQYIFGAGWAKSNADPKSRAVFYYKGHSKNQQMAVEVKGYIPNTNGLDLTDSLKIEPEAQYEVKVQCGQSEEEAAKVSAKVSATRSEERKRYLMEEEPLYNVCKKQMQEGNFQLPACQNMTMESNFLDNIKIELQFHNLKKECKNIINGLFFFFFANLYPMTKVSNMDSRNSENQVDVEIQFQPEDFRQVDVTVEANDQRTEMVNLTLHSLIPRALFVPHPVFHVKSRFMGALKGWENYRRTAVIDQTAAQTFNNKTYPLSLSNHWTVVAQYIPKVARQSGRPQETVENQLKHQAQNYVVLVRQASPQEKELMISFNRPESDGKTIEINLKANQQGQQSGNNPAAKVYVNSKQVQFTDKQIADLYNGIVEIYALPNGEVKVEIQDVFYAIFDGKRVKLTATGSHLRESTAGLAGRFSQDIWEDFTVPANCVVKDYQKFAQSYQVQANQQTRQQRSNEFNQQCIPKNMPLYTNVITDKDIGRKGAQADQESSGSQLKHRYVEQDGEICFTVRPMPVCNGQSRQTISKNVAVHCIQNSKTAYYFKKQIDQGGNPDFSHKSESKKVQMEIDTQC